MLLINLSVEEEETERTYRATGVLGRRNDDDSRTGFRFQKKRSQLICEQVVSQVTDCHGGFVIVHGGEIGTVTNDSIVDQEVQSISHIHNLLRKIFYEFQRI